MPNLFIDILLSNPDALVTIITDKWAIEAFLAEAISLSGASDWNSPEDQSAAGPIGKQVGAVVTTANKMGAGISQAQVKSLSSSMQSWSGCQNLTLDLGLVFIATRDTDDVREKVRKLYSMVLPTIQGSMNLAAKITAPLGYAFGAASNPTGTIGVKIGRWFKMPQKLMVCQNVSFTFSREVIPSGKPLYATGRVTLISCRIIPITEMDSFLS